MENKGKIKMWQVQKLTKWSREYNEAKNKKTFFKKCIKEMAELSNKNIGQKKEILLTKCSWKECNKIFEIPLCDKKIRNSKKYNLRNYCCTAHRRHDYGKFINENRKSKILYG